MYLKVRGPTCKLRQDGSREIQKQKSPREPCSGLFAHIGESTAFQVASTCLLTSPTRFATTSVGTEPFRYSFSPSRLWATTFVDLGRKCFRIRLSEQKAYLKSDVLSLLKSIGARKCRLAKGWEQVSSGVDPGRK